MHVLTFSYEVLHVLNIVGKIRKNYVRVLSFINFDYVFDHLIWEREEKDKDESDCEMWTKEDHYKSMVI